MECWPMMRQLKAATVIALLGTGPAAADLANENLLVTMPPGYKVDFRTQHNDMVMSEMVPENETVQAWTEMLTVQVFHGLKTTPEAFRDTLQQGWIADCPGASAQTVAGGVESGYSALVWLLDCPRNPETGKPEMTWFKAIQGNDSFYVVQKAFKFVPAKEQIGQWMRYLKAIAVCDTRLPDRPCPQQQN
jgi:hypothetical protein